MFQAARRRIYHCSTVLNKKDYDLLARSNRSSNLTEFESVDSDCRRAQDLQSRRNKLRILYPIKFLCLIKEHVISDIRQAGVDDFIQVSGHYAHRVCQQRPR